MRSEKEGYRPSAWTSFAGQQLTTLDAVTALAVAAESGTDPSQRLLTWTIGANAADYPVEVYIRLSAESSAADRLVAILPKGSNRFLLTELDIANRTATVKHRETAPFNGASAVDDRRQHGERRGDSRRASQPCRLSRRTTSRWRQPGARRYLWHRRQRRGLPLRDRDHILIDAVGKLVKPALKINQSTSLNGQGSIMPATSPLLPFNYNAGGPATGKMWVAFNWSSFTGFLPDGSFFTVPSSASLPTPPSPTLSQVAGGALGGRTLFARIGYLKNHMMVHVGAEASFVVSANNLLKVTSPPAVAGYDGWLPLIGSSSNGEFIQLETGFGTDFTESPAGFNATTTTPYDNTNMPAGVTAYQMPSSTTIYWYPFYDIALATTVFPDNGQLARNAGTAALQNGDGRIGLSPGGMSVAVPAAGGSTSGTATNGGGKFI
jgi:hypothetical protein